MVSEAQARWWPMTRMMASLLLSSLIFSHHCRLHRSGNAHFLILQEIAHRRRRRRMECWRKRSICSLISVLGPSSPGEQSVGQPPTLLVQAQAKLPIAGKVKFRQKAPSSHLYAHMVCFLTCFLPVSFSPNYPNLCVHVCCTCLHWCEGQSLSFSSTFRCCFLLDAFCSLRLEIVSSSSSFLSHHHHHLAHTGRLLKEFLIMAWNDFLLQSKAD